jgi:hypothetical protein
VHDVYRDKSVRDRDASGLMMSFAHTFSHLSCPLVCYYAYVRVYIGAFANYPANYPTRLIKVARVNNGYV